MGQAKYGHILVLHIGCAWLLRGIILVSAKRFTTVKYKYFTSNLPGIFHTSLPLMFIYYQYNLTG